MIIAAYAGAGKSTFAQRIENTADLPIMPRSWILAPQGPKEEGEREKGRLDRLPDPFFPENYIIDILQAERDHDYVLIPTNLHIVSRLREKYGRKVVLCYPGDEQKEEYRERFAARGNREEFFSLFIEDWDRFLGPIREYEDAVHIIMGAGTYLTDLKERLDEERAQDDTQPVPQEDIAELERELQSLRGDYLLRVDQDLWYRIPDILDPEERSFLAGLSRKDAGMEMRILPSYLLSPEDTVTDDRARVLERLERSEESGE